MLRIKRVPTIVSNFQKEDDAKDGSGDGGGRRGCGRNCLSKCCVEGAMLSLYAFSSKKKVKDLGMGGGEEEAELSFLSALLLGQWEDRLQRGLFRYDVTASETKVHQINLGQTAHFFVIPGKYGFIAQLNEGRHLKKRPTEFRVDKVLQPFDGSKFNFTKVGQEEVLFMFEEGDGGESRYFESAPVESGRRDRSVVAINVSPIEYGHVLLIPHILDCLSQRIDRESLLLALHMAAEADSPYFRLGYNSLGAFATINHLHFQAYYLSMPFPVEKAPTQKIMALASGVNVLQLLEYPVRGLVFEDGSSFQDLSIAVSGACIFLQDNNIPYNVLVSDLGKRIFLFPQCYAEKQALGEVSQELLDTQVNPAVWEISGHMVLKRKKDYEEASEENAWRLLAEVSLSAERFQEVKDYILDAILGDTSEETIDIAQSIDEKKGNEEEDAMSKSAWADARPWEAGMPCSSVTTK